MGNMGVASFTRCRIPHLIAALTCVAKTYSVLCYAAAPLVLMNIALFGQSPDVCYSTVRSSATAARRSTNDCSSADLADAGVGDYRPLPHDFAHGGCHETTADTSRVYQATPGREGRNDGQSWSVFGLVDHPGAPYAFPAWSSQWTCSGVSPHSPLRASSGFAPDSHEAVHTYGFTNSLLSAMLSIAPWGSMRTRIRMNEFNLIRFLTRSFTGSSHVTWRPRHPPSPRFAPQ